MKMLLTLGFVATCALAFYLLGPDPRSDPRTRLILAAEHTTTCTPGGQGLCGACTTCSSCRHCNASPNQHCSVCR